MKFILFKYVRFFVTLGILLTGNVQASIINIGLTFDGQGGPSYLDLNIDTNTFTGVIDNTHSLGLVQATFNSYLYSSAQVLSNFDFNFESSFDFVNGDLTMFDQFDVSQINLSFDDFIGLGTGYFNYVNSTFHWLDSATASCITNCATSNNVPEPSILALMALGLMGFGVSLRKKEK